MFEEQRQRFVDWVRTQLIGGDKRQRELFGIYPTDRYPCGVLYPVSSWGDGIDPATEDFEADDGGVGPESVSDDSLEAVTVQRRYVPPSSLGFSFFISGDDIQFQVIGTAVRYRPQGKPDQDGRYRDSDGRYINNWTREPIPFAPNDALVFRRIEGVDRERIAVFGEQVAHIDILWRPHADGWIVTISLCNAQEMPEIVERIADERARNSLFETQLRCVVDSGSIGSYPRVDMSLLDEEEQELEIQYCSRHIYAIGHGTAVEWIVDDNERVLELYSSAIPAVEVPQMTADTNSAAGSVLSLAYLSNFASNRADILDDLAGFVDGYAEWVSEQKRHSQELPHTDRPAGERITARMDTAVSRMQEGIRLIADEPRVALAFALANQAMLDQMLQLDLVNGCQRACESYKWRPFQLAFLLTVLESAANDNSEFRDLVDLIWFPTGGGKTEAYLGLIAILVVLRRLRFPTSGGGTAVLMRYTLRLLTRDQFVRAARLICALELLRRSRNDLGEERISIGMWVGEATSPNTCSKALELLRNAKHGTAPIGLVLQQCPWCGHEFSAPGSYECAPQAFGYRCRNAKCAFGSSPEGILPCNVIDEALYNQPPTLLIATLDKFARLAWDERSSAFFGVGESRPPELVIQDELHLIAGALGSVAGLYEAGIDTALTLRGVHPKYIASTATIRMAAQQVRRLYGRDVAVFPPPGLSCDDSYFARTVPLSERPGRLYVGYLAPMLGRQQCLAPLAAALLQAPLALFPDQEDAEVLLDAWWTQVMYHGSLKGVGNTHTVLDTSARDFLRTLDGGAGDTQNERQSGQRARPTIAQLTSTQSAEQNGEIFARLRVPRSQEGCLDAVLATNMISVGLDVSRLALMVINGQPLTTAEYIQASSRVGRAEVPGIVFVNYYRDQARSLSHYESFRPYHEAFYRFVEPTSVTPYTYQARSRALHAALVITLRHAGLGLLGNECAGGLDPGRPGVVKAIDALAARCRRADAQAADESRQHLDALIEAWYAEIERCRVARRRLDYQVPDNENRRDRLLFNFNDHVRGLWPTLQSMRYVENTGLIKVLS